jgi:hypothetical protein
MEIRITNETLIDDLELSVRTANCLHNLYRDAKGLQYREPYAEQERPRIKDLRHISDNEMLRTYNFGRKSLAEWKHVLWLVDQSDGGTASNEYHTAQELKDVLSRIDRTRHDLGHLVRHARDLVDVLEKIGASYGG